MADIELVIKIPEEDYETLINTNDSRTPSMIARRNLYKALKNGTPLPKGHGRIADVDKMLDEMRATRTYDILFALERVKPILEADKGGEE